MVLGFISLMMVLENLLQLLNLLNGNVIEIFIVLEQSIYLKITLIVFKQVIIIIILLDDINANGWLKDWNPELYYSTLQRLGVQEADFWAQYNDSEDESLNENEVIVTGNIYISIIYNRLR